MSCVCDVLNYQLSKYGSLSQIHAFYEDERPLRHEIWRVRNKQSVRFFLSLFLARFLVYGSKLPGNIMFGFRTLVVLSFLPRGKVNISARNRGGAII